ncbi:MAG: tripartite tricarboxylate transporter substrate binding protein [Betaproteobacteria bacterium]|nr:tripartite tricarboxylate transporter substrate binding protein [Betaproteobacteria bacterium]
MKCRTGLVLAAFAALWLCGVNVASAQSYPAKPVRMFVSSPPGGPGDLAARGFSQALGAVMGQPFVIETRSGADGIIAGEACARATPDGHSLCVLDGFNVAANPAVRLKMPYDTVRDFEPVAHLGALGAAVTSHLNAPYNTFAELLEFARKNPNQVKWATFGAAASPMLYMEWLRNVRNVHLFNVPYKTAPAAFTAVMAGEADATVYSVGLTAAQVRGGKVKILAVNTDSRHPMAPTAPTIRETGIDVAVVLWFGVFAPAKTPRDIVRRLNAESTKSFLNDATLREKFLTASGMVVQAPAGEPPEAFAEFILKDKANYATLFKLAKVEPQ